MAHNPLWLPNLEVIMRSVIARESTHRRAGEVMTWVDAHLAEPLSLGAIAAHLSLSPATTTRLFTAAFSMPPARFLRERRIARAADLLTTTRNRIETIAEDCGFHSRSHFTRVFSQHMGVGPAQYRRIRRNHVSWMRRASPYVPKKLTPPLRW